MHRLHVKIFLWFWLGVVVVSTTLVTLAMLTHSRAEDDSLWRSKYTPRVDLWADQEARVLRTSGRAALATYVGSFQADPGVLNYIFDGNGEEVLRRHASPRILQIVASMSGSPGGVQQVDEGRRIIAEKVIDEEGDQYVVVVSWPPPSILSRSLFDLLAIDIEDNGVPAGALSRLLAVVAVAGVFCFMLARHIASPIARLRSATQAIANEQLHTRVDRKVLTRRDELADLGHDFDRMAARIEHSVNAQRQLLADVSHALRSPLARLSVALGLARRGGEAAISGHLDRIERETERLNALIGQLLAMARMNTGFELERRAMFDLGGVVDEVATDADFEARSRQCTVRFDQRRECLVEGARDMLRDAVENVVRNAVYHTAEATSVHISVDCRYIQGVPRAVIQVSDHGPGVPEESVARLFTPFYRVVDGRETSSGTGLGLAIARRAFEIHGGTATAANAGGGGLVVTLEMPLKVAEGVPGPAHSRAEPYVGTVGPAELRA